METQTQENTITTLIDKMAALRQQGDAGLVKRTGFTQFPELNENIEFQKPYDLSHASFGYVERLFRKLDQKYPNQVFQKMDFLHYQEACGYFEGEIMLHWKDNSNESVKEYVKFSWEGKGEIENTWDQFLTWQTKTNPELN